MEKTTPQISALATSELFITMAVSAWDTQNKRINDLLGKLTDEELSAETAPGRNTGLYLLGHLTAISDAMMPILGWGERKHAALDKAFVDTPDKSGIDMPPPQQVRKYWNEVNQKVSECILAMKASDWFARHSLVSEEDFQRQPHRNKLNVLINRTNHHSYHYGQMIYLVRGS